MTMKNKNNKTHRNKKRSSIFRRKSRKYIRNMTGQSMMGGQEENEKERQGVLDIVGSKIGEKTDDITNYLTTKTARLLGYKPIDEEKETGQAIDDAVAPVLEKGASMLEEGASALGEGAALVDQGAATAVQGINEILDAPQTEMAVQEAAEATKEITEDLLENFNKPFEDPNFKKEVKEAADNAAVGATIVLNALDKPIDMAIDKTNKSMVKIGEAVAAGSVKVATDALASVPGFGAIFDIGRMINDGSRAAASVVEAGSEIIETGSDLVTASIDSVENAMEDYKNLGSTIKEKSNIQNRIDKSINDFTKPNYPKSIIGGKTRKRLFKKRNGKKTKHVRFAF